MRLLHLKTILVAIEFDEASEPALRTGAQLAALAGGRLHLLHVVSARTYDRALRLREYYRAVVPRGPEPAGVEILNGAPADVIVARARALEADAIVLGAHRRRTDGADLGTTAAQVVRAAPCPCLVAATELQLPLRRVIAPIDLSPIARGALSVALTWTSALRSREAGTSLTAIHFCHESDGEDIDARVHEEVEHARAHAAGTGAITIAERIETGEPVEGIIRAAADADLLVMGTRGVTDAVAGLGGVAAAVARANPGPLVLVPPATWRERSASE